MNTLHNTIIFLWIVPAVALVVVPLLWSLFKTLYNTIERYRLAEIRGYVTDDTNETEQRHLNRIHVEAVKAYVDEKNDCCEATVSNISKEGICLKNINCNINPDTEHLRVVFRTRKKDYNLTAKPTWKKLTEKGYEIGAAIDRIPSGWDKLVKGATNSFNPARA